jgi:hypothetical protein
VRCRQHARLQDFGSGRPLFRVPICRRIEVGRHSSARCEAAVSCELRWRRRLSSPRRLRHGLTPGGVPTWSIDGNSRRGSHGAGT